MHRTGNRAKNDGHVGSSTAGYTGSHCQSDTW